MVFLEPSPTSADLRFRLLGISVRVHPMFWLVSVMMGWDLQRLGMGYVLLWVACVFVSILFHEIGHVLMGRWFGAHGHIVLYGFGGLAIGSSSMANRWKRIAVYLAGPVANFIFYGVLWLGFSRIAVKQVAPFWLFLAMEFLFWINVFWGAVNLLPVWPLDGGQVSRDFLGWLLPRNGLRVSLGISLVVAGALSVNAFAADSGRAFIPIEGIGGAYFGILFALLAFGSFQGLMAENQRQRWTKEHFHEPWHEEQHQWESDGDAWKR